MKDKIIGILQKEMFNITTEAGDAYSVVIVCPKCGGTDIWGDHYLGNNCACGYKF